MGATYSVQIQTQPAEQTCVVQNNTGAISANPATIVSVRCTESCIPPENSVSSASNNTINEVHATGVIDVFASGTKVYAATVRGGLYISTDGGKMWRKTLIGSLRGVYASGTKVYAVFSDRLVISTDCGTSWIEKILWISEANGVKSKYLTNVHVSDGTIYVASWDGLFISADGGTTWERKNPPSGLAGDDEVSQVFASGTTIYAGYQYLSISNDGGTTWVNKYKGYTNDFYASGKTIYLSNLDGLEISTDAGKTWVQKTWVHGLGERGDGGVNHVHATGSKVYASTWGSGLYISNDGGATWFKKTTSDGLASNYVNGAHASGTTVIVSTREGLSVFRD